MFSVKICHKKEQRNPELTKTISNVISYISNKLNISNAKTISDSSCVEIVSGKEIPSDDNEIMVELLIRKYVIINVKDLQDKSKLDAHVYKIKHFCEQAKEIEELKYLPINMR